MATSCQSCDTIGLIPTAPPYAGPPPAPPVQGCSAVWGSITGTIANQTDLTAYIKSLAEEKSVTLFKDEDTGIEGDTPTPETQLSYQLQAQSAYHIHVHLVTSWPEPTESASLTGRVRGPTGSTFWGNWTFISNGRVKYAGYDVNEFNNVRSSTFEEEPLDAATDTHILVQTGVGTGNFFMQFLPSNPSAQFLIRAGSWIRVQKVSPLTILPLLPPPP